MSIHTIIFFILLLLVNKYIIAALDINRDPLNLKSKTNHNFINNELKKIINEHQKKIRYKIEKVIKLGNFNPAGVIYVISFPDTNGFSDKNINKFIELKILDILCNFILFFIEDEIDIMKLKSVFSIGYIYNLKYRITWADYNYNYMIAVFQIVTNYFYLKPPVFSLVTSKDPSNTILKLQKKYPDHEINESQIIFDEKIFIVYYLSINGVIRKYLDENHIIDTYSSFQNISSLLFFETNDKIIFESTIDSSFYENNTDLHFSFINGIITAYNENNVIYNSIDIPIIEKIAITTPYYLVWKNDTMLKIDLPWHTCQSNTNNYPYFTYNIKDKSTQYHEYNTDVKYNIVSNSLIHNKFIYGLDNCFIVENDGDYKILMINYKNLDLKSKMFSAYYLRPWLHIDNNISDIDPDISSKIVNEHYSRIRDATFYLIDIDYTGLFLKISDVESFYSYFIYCNIAEKINVIDGLYSLSSIFMKNDNDTVQENMKNDNNTVQEILKNDNNMVREILKYPVTPFNFYFDNKYFNISGSHTYLETLFDGVSAEDYEIRSNYYINRYNRNAHDIMPQFYKKEISINTKLISFIKNIKENGSMKKTNITNIDTDYEFYNTVQKFINYSNNTKSQGEYLNCEFSNDILFQNLTNNLIKCSENWQNIIAELYHTLGLISSYDTSDVNNILVNHEKYYALIEYKKKQDICEKLKKIAEDDSNKCNKSLMISGIIDDYYVYNNNRNIIIILFEILFGNFIRDDQYNVFHDIVNEIDSDMNFNIRQMLMGKGKTSVITPLLIFEFIFNRNNFYNIIIVLPKHLIFQTYTMITSQYSYIMPFVKINIMNIRRDTIFSTTSSYFSNSMNDRRIIITDIASLQSIQLNIAEKNEKLPFNQDRCLFIFDEIDSLADPISNELNYPKNKRSADIYHIFSRELIVLISWRIIDDDILLPIIDDTSRRNLLKKIFDEIVPKYFHVFKSLNTTINDFKCQYMVNKIFSTFDMSLQKIFTKDYGFDDSDNNFIAIPYAHVNTPLTGSEFTDSEVKMTFTSLSYFIGGLRKTDENNIRNRLINIYNQNIEYPFLLREDNLIKILRINVDDITGIDYLQNYNIDILKNNSEFIKNYLLTEIYPKFITRYRKQYNASFIDVAGSIFSKYKTGFSGTVSGIHMKDILNYDTVDQKYIFNNVIEDTVAMGAMYSSLVGATQEKNMQSKIYRIDSDVNMINNIIYLLNHEKYDALIDTGAYLRKYESHEMIDIIITNCGHHKKYIYFDKFDKRHDIININKKDDISAPETFIYYDQKHTVGIDVPNQPYKLKGLVTVNYFNRLTDISQGVYRLRKMNYGHTVDYIISNIKQTFGAVDQLVQYLINKDHEYKQQTEKIAVLQQVKYILRKNTNYPYLDKLYDELKYINTRQDLTQDNYSKYITDTYCQNPILVELCGKIRGIKENKLQIGVNIAQQIVINTEITANIITEIVRNYSVVDYEKMVINYGYEWLLENYFDEKFKVYDYFSESPQDKIDLLTTVLNNNNIILSPNMFCTRYDIMKNRETVFTNNWINFYNYYSIEIIKLDRDKIYILIKDFEYTIIQNYLMENKMTDIIIRNKKNKIVYPENHKSKYNEKIDDMRLMLIKYILNGDMNIIDTIMCVKYLITNIDYKIFNKFFEMIGYFLLTSYETDSVHKLMKYWHEINNGLDDYDVIIKKLFMDKSNDNIFQKIFNYNINIQQKKLLYGHYIKINKQPVQHNCTKYKYLYDKYKSKLNNLIQ